MFFADPVGAFTNIGRALRPGARLVLLVWQERDRNEWATAIRQSLAAASATPRSPDPFSLADPTVTEGILGAAGFTEVSFTDVREPVYYGPDSATAFEAVSALWGFRDPQARTRLRATLDAHHTDDGVYFDSRAWIVTARRP
jgi:SAM-dependent methyltransferase